MRMPLLFLGVGILAGMVVVVGELRNDASHWKGTRGEGQHGTRPEDPAPFSSDAAVYSKQMTAASVQTGAAVVDFPSAATEQWAAQISAGLDSVRPTEREHVFSDLLPGFVKADARGAARFAEGYNDPDGTHVEVMRVVAENWVRLNFDDAWSWASRLRDANERDTMQSCICFEAAKSDPERALRALDSGDLDERQEAILGNLAQMWATRDLNAALAWAESRSSGDSRDRLVAQVALAESSRAPADAARIVAEQMPAGGAQESAVLALLDVWTPQDPDAASAWVAQFPEEDLRRRAEEKIAGILQPQPLVVKLPVGP